MTLYTNCIFGSGCNLEGRLVGEPERQILSLPGQTIRSHHQPTDLKEKVVPISAPGPKPPNFLRAMSSAEASRLIAYARRMRIALSGEPSMPVAWSKIHNSCEERTLALQYVLASAPVTLEDRAPEMREEDLELDYLLDLARAPGRSVASISITGPLITHQTVVLDGDARHDVPGPISWVFHAGVAVNIEGELNVLDLSMGNEPIPVTSWYRGFVPSGIECEQVSEQKYENVLSVWKIDEAQHVEPESDRTPWECAYTVTPIFTFPDSPDPVVKTLQDVPWILHEQLELFIAEMGKEQNFIQSESLSGLLSYYRPGTTEDLCINFQHHYCLMFGLGMEHPNP